jgi:hypothetical protein
VTVDANTADISVKSAHVFLHKQVLGYTLILHVHFQDCFACCTSFLTRFPQLLPSSASSSNLSLRRRHKNMPPFPVEDEKDEETLIKFNKSLALVMDQLDTNAFSYDFHLRQFYSYLTDAHSDLPPFHVLQMMLGFQRVYGFSPAAYARNHLVTGSFEVPLSGSISDQREFLKYLSTKAGDYGFSESVGQSRFGGLDPFLLLQTHRGSFAKTELSGLWKSFEHTLMFSSSNLASSSSSNSSGSSGPISYYFVAMLPFEVC